MLRFSIIIPNYNKEKYLNECLDSIINQTIDKSKYEIIFVDDASSDNSLEIIKNYDIKLYHSNRGLAGGARNIGIDNATGEYIIFLDSDDFLTNNTVLEKLDNLITDEDLIYLNYTKQTPLGDIEIIEENTTKLDKIATTKNLGCPSKCVKRELLNDIRFPEKFYYEDVSFSIEIMCKSQKEAYFNDSFYTYRYVPGSITKIQEISAKKMTDVLIQISKLYYFCDKYPEYKDALLFRIRKDKLPLRLEILDEYFSTGKKTFFDHFK